jgi:hypothetical protein
MSVMSFFPLNSHIIKISEEFFKNTVFPLSDVSFLGMAIGMGMVVRIYGVWSIAKYCQNLHCFKCLEGLENFQI